MLNLEGLGHAWRGLRLAFLEEDNFRLELFLALIALALGVLYKLNIAGWCWICLSIFLVFLAELLNSALERAVDIFSDERFLALARDAKDLAAGAVLLSCVQALGAAWCLFVWPLYG